MLGLTRSKVETALDVLLRGGFPWVMPAATGAKPLERRFRRRARRLIVGRWPPVLRPMAAVLMALLWPVVAVRDAILSVRSALPGSLGDAGRSGLVFAAVRCALRHNVLPVEFLAYRMFEGSGENVDAWSLGDEGTRVFADLADREAIALADDKHAFAEFCAGIGVPAVPTLALYANGQVILPFAEGALPAANLVSKPRRAACTVGIEPWFYRAGAYHRTSGDPAAVPRNPGPPLSPEELDRHLIGLTARYSDILLQPMLRPHPSLAVLSGEGVLTARVVTGLWPDGDVTIIDAMAQRPSGGDFVSQGAYFALIDPESGRIRDDAEGQLRPVFMSARRDAAMLGMVLPDWDDARAIVLRAHARFPARVVLLGWDVAFTPDGPTILETNIGLSFFQFQMASLRPALRGPLGPLMEAWL